MTNLDDGDPLFESIKAGAATCVTRQIGPDDLVDIVRRVHAGEYVMLADPEGNRFCVTDAGPRAPS